MILAVDAGNSRLTLGAFETPLPATGPRPPRAVHAWSVPTHPAADPDALRARISAALAESGNALGDFRAVVLASVVPAVTQALRAAIPGLLVIDHAWPFSFDIGTTEPARTGIDRLVDAEAVLRESPGLLDRARSPARSVIVVDAGTATTIDALESREGQRPLFSGGAIAPGLAILRDAMAARGAQLHAIELAAPERAIGRDTDSALRSGIVLGYSMMIDGLVARMRSELPGPVRIVATGGLSSLLHAVCKQLPEPDPELTLKGIAYLYESLRTR